ncbi:MAG: hypothetical protein GF349_03590 [Candidatus Magasanikbacteria bacterium]|nr:hypothetical protein [Candidatus Magasanikbacteria bacterium]
MKQNKIIMIIAIILFIIVLFYLFLWLISRKEYNVEYGISYNQYQAESLELDWQKVYIDMLESLEPEYVRIAAMWSEIEPERGYYDFSKVDWMMDKAAENDTKITLVLGQKAPRWPECHVPDWVENLNEEQYRTRLLSYIAKVVERYKNHPALELWQVENEPFIKFRFGECDNYREDLVYDEIDLVKLLDGNKKILITDSGELSTWRQAINAGDIFGTTLYRVVRAYKGVVFSYNWLPPSVYRLKAQLYDKDMDNVIVSELQAEPWFTNGGALHTPIEEQEKTMNTERLIKHFRYVERIGVPRAYLWGVEWWYWMKEKQENNFYWDYVKMKLKSS